MIKTTNYEISKKLAEIGFKAKAEKCWAKIKHSVQHPSLSEFNLVNLDFAVPQNCDEWVLSHDLETLLDALPKAFDVMQEIYPTGFHLNIDLNENAQTFSYIEDGLLSLQEHHEEAFVVKTQEESLADVAGRMIIALHKKNLIKF
jgi:hypothetical protein